jgi:hypothetical protein
MLAGFPERRDTSAQGAHSSAGEHPAYNRTATGSIPVAPTIFECPSGPDWIAYHFEAEELPRSSGKFRVERWNAHRVSAVRVDRLADRVVHGLEVAALVRPDQPGGHRFEPVAPTLFECLCGLIDPMSIFATDLVGMVASPMRYPGAIAKRGDLVPWGRQGRADRQGE